VVVSLCDKKYNFHIQIQFEVMMMMLHSREKSDKNLRQAEKLENVNISDESVQNV